jgi:hypothetical protein
LYSVLHNLTQTSNPGFFQRLTNLALFIGKIAQIWYRIISHIGEGEEDDGLFGLGWHVERTPLWKEMDSILEMEPIFFDQFQHFSIS